MDPLDELAQVYGDAEHALSLLLSDEVRADLDRDPDGAGGILEDVARAAAARRVRVAAQATVGRLNGQVPPIVRRALDEAAQTGSYAAAAEVRNLLGVDLDDTESIDRRRLDQLAAAVMDQVTPAHAAILRTVPDAYRQVIQRATPGLVVGAQTRREAAQRAMVELARRGVTSFTDAAGRRWELTSYVEMALRTAAHRTEIAARAEKLLADGHELAMVSDHPQECVVCRPFEGKVIALAGPAGKRRVPRRPGGKGRLVTVDVVATLAEAIARGLLHPNCRHTITLYVPGVTKAPTGPGTGPDPEGDEARQRQRAIERQIRAYKRRADLAVTPAAKKAARAHVRAWQERMRQHIAAHPDLRRLTYREAPGAGNNPTPGLLAELAGGSPFPDLPRDSRGEARAREETDREREQAEADARAERERAEARARAEREREEREQAQREQAEREQAEAQARAGAGRVLTFDVLREEYELDGGPVFPGAIAEVTVYRRKDNGEKLIVKRTRSALESVNEEVTARIAGLFGAKVPKVTRLDDRTTAHEFVAGRALIELLTSGTAEDDPLLRGPDAAALALLDAVTGQKDRHPGNVLVGEDGALWGIDHSDMWKKTQVGKRMEFWSFFADPADYPEITTARLEALRPELVALRPDLVAAYGDRRDPARRAASLGAAHHDRLVENLDALIEHLRGKR